MPDNTTVATAALHDVASDASADPAHRVAAASTLLYAPTADAPPSPPVNHVGVAVSAVSALVAVKDNAIERKNEAESVIGHIHDIAVRELVLAESWAKAALPYVIVSAASASAGALAVWFFH